MYRDSASAHYTANNKRRPSAKTGGVCCTVDPAGPRGGKLSECGYSRARRVHGTSPHRVVHGLHVLVFFELVDEFFHFLGLLIVE
jgi:hypothetical protein